MIDMVKRGGQFMIGEWRHITLNNKDKVASGDSNLQPTPFIVIWHKFEIESKKTHDLKYRQNIKKWYAAALRHPTKWLDGYVINTDRVDVTIKILFQLSLISVSQPPNQKFEKSMKSSRVA